jgi:hypothetical protein
MSEESNLDYLGLLFLIDHPRLLDIALRVRELELALFRSRSAMGIIGLAKCRLELQRVQDRLECIRQERGGLLERAFRRRR